MEGLGLTLSLFMEGLIYFSLLNPFFILFFTQKKFFNFIIPNTQIKMILKRGGGGKNDNINNNDN